MKTRFCIFLFSATLFALTVLGLLWLYYRTLALPLWFIFAYVVAWPFAIVLGIETIEGVSKKKLLALIFAMIITSTIVTHTAVTVATPRWSFSVSTDKLAYRLGEPVSVTTSLMNTGYITHCFKSSVSNPVVISIELSMFEIQALKEYGYSQVWYNQFTYEETHFSVGPNQVLQRDFLWNQTDVRHTERQIIPAEYVIGALIPSPESTFVGTSPLFSAWTRISITSV